MLTAETILRFEELGMELACSLRRGTGITPEQCNDYARFLDALVGQAAGCEHIPKRLAYAFMVLRDNLIGTHTNHTNEPSLIAQTLSRLDLAFEEILQSD